MECSTKVSCNKTCNSMSQTGVNRCPDPVQGETEQNLDSPELDIVAGVANATEATVVDESPINLGRQTVKKRRGPRTEYWVAYEEYMDEKNCRRARCKHCGTTYACDSNKNGTKNVKNHFQACEKKSG
ncbi:hypothetical protein QQ045_009624 [Rhodiola kirilowii]